MRQIAQTELRVFPLCLGGNVFGWTADAAQSLAVLDAYAAAGGNFIDTADVYSQWVPGHQGGESEALIGDWLRTQRRDHIVIATKVGMAKGRDNLRPATLRAAVEDSLKRLKTDYIDLYYAHKDDEATPQEDTARAFDALIKEGKVRYVAASNFSAARLQSALQISKQHGLAQYVAIQPHYNLVEREHYEGALQDLTVRAGLSCVPYFALAKGFLSGKYRPGAKVDSVRAQGASAYLNERGLKLLAALDTLSERHRVPVGTLALAWLNAQPGVVAPIASARTPEQLAELLKLEDVKLSDADLALLA